MLEKSIAKIGYTFTHMGGTEVCSKCSLRKVCVEALEKNVSYEVQKIGTKEHRCLVDDQIMILCEVEETNSIITVENQKYLENIIINRKPLNCNEIFCENYEHCINPSFHEQSKVKILKILNKVNCPLDYNLVLVEAKKA
ncbi:MAG: UPF0179 family protein [Candidatus Thorarchaeota archaeon]